MFELSQILTRAARLYPEQVAAVCGHQRLTYREVADRTAQTAGVLAGLGVGFGDRVALLHPNCHLFLEWYFAAAWCGAILVPLNTRLARPEIERILADASPRLLVVHPHFAEVVLDLDLPADFTVVWTEVPTVLGPGQVALEELREPVDPVWPASPRDPEELAQLYYTSGTTGRPKGVMLSHRNVASHALMAIAELHLTDRDVWLHAAPMFHLADAWATWAITWVGGRHVFLPAFSPQAAVTLMGIEGVTVTNLVPTMLAQMVEIQETEATLLPALRLLLSGGAPITPSLVRRIIAAFGCEYVQTYGLTETSPYLTLSLPSVGVLAEGAELELEYRAMTGRPMLGVEVRVVDERGEEVPWDGETVGEIVARGPTITAGYWGQPDETERAFTDGWFHTGDLAVVEARGYLTIVDRKKDTIITGGENVYSTEVEHVLAEHPEVREVAVVGVPDPEWGEALLACVVPRGEPPSPEELKAFCRERLAGFKVPSRFEFIDHLPRTGSGKIAKAELRRPYWEGRSRQVG